MTDPIASAASRALDESSQPAPACIGMRRHEILVDRARRMSSGLIADGYEDAANLIEELIGEYEIAVAQALRLERIVHGATKLC